jgi:CheY-like chemotaxis protein
MRRAEAATVAVDRRTLRQRRRAETEVDEANYSIDQYLGMLGHELRNPLAAILAASDVLARRDTGDAVIERIQTILARQTGHMARIVDGLLDVSRIARGKIELQREPLDLPTVLAPLIADFEARAAARRLAFDHSTTAPALFIEGDRVRLFQIVEGVLSNALKFTPSGGTVRFRLETDDHDAVIRIEDTGEGIDPALMPRIFEPFWQGPQSYDRARGGLGLGLALVRGLVMLHGGAVTAHSDGNDCGTTVTIRFPRAQPATADRSSSPDGIACPLQVLVVEDNVDAAVMIVELLVQAGHRAEVAHDGPGALAAVTASTPDVIVCDLGLPGGMNGYDVARTLRREPAFENVRLVALSGYGRPEDKAEAARAGFDVHLTKPVDFRALSRALSR